MLAPVRGWRSETSSHRRQTPFLYVGFDENKPHLPKVDMNRAWPVGANCRKEILSLQIMRHFVKFLSVAGKEYTACPRSISDPNHIALHIWRTVGRGRERLVISSVTGRDIRDGCLVVTFDPLVLGTSRYNVGPAHTWESEKRVWFGGHSNTDQTGFRLVVDLGLPVVYFILFRNGQIALNTTFRVKEFDFRSGFDKAVGDFQLGLEFPSGNALFLDGQELRQRYIGLDGLGWVCLDKSCTTCQCLDIARLVQQGCPPFALRYSALCNSSIVSRASASSCAKACSSSNSPGRPIRSSRMRPLDVYLKKKTIASTRTAMPAEPKADKTPMRIPRPVDPPSLMFMTIEPVGPSVADRNRPCRQVEGSLKCGTEVESEVRDVGVGRIEVSNVIASRSCWICSAPGCIAPKMGVSDGKMKEELKRGRRLWRSQGLMGRRYPQAVAGSRPVKGARSERNGSMLRSEGI